jgi:hypothetical protein
MTNSASPTLAAGAALPIVPLNYELLACGRFFDTSTTSLLWRERQSGTTVLWHLNSDGSLDTRSAAEMPNGVAPSRAFIVVPQEWVATDSGDADNDGLDDILWMNRSSGQVVLWKMAGNDITASSATEPDARYLPRADYAQPALVARFSTVRPGIEDVTLVKSIVIQGVDGWFSDTQSFPAIQTGLVRRELTGITIGAEIQRNCGPLGTFTAPCSPL